MQQTELSDRHNVLKTEPREVQAQSDGLQTHTGVRSIKHKARGSKCVAWGVKHTAHSTWHVKRSMECEAHSTQLKARGT